MPPDPIGDHVGAHPVDNDGASASIADRRRASSVDGTVSGVDGTVGTNDAGSGLGDIAADPTTDAASTPVRRGPSRPNRTIRYRDIARQLRERVERGEFVAGRVLPSEAELSKRYRASRVTIRRALEALRTEGLVSSRQGFGWFVPADLLRQSLGRLGTIEAQLADSGIASERQILGFSFVEAPPRVEHVLGTSSVLEVRRLNLANSAPFARVTVWCPQRLGAQLSRDQVEASPLYELLDVPLGGATQTIGAAAVGASDAKLLGIPEGSPVLVCERTTRDTNGVAVLFSEHVFPGHLTEFSVELPNADASMAPSGLRLVE